MNTEWENEFYEFTTSTVSIKQEVVSADELGGEVRTIGSTLYSGLKASIQELSPSLVGDYDRRGVICSHKVLIPTFSTYTGNIKIGQLITDDNNRNYEITMIRDFADNSPLLNILCEYRAS